MSNKSIRSSVLVGFALTALSALTACADMNADDQQIIDSESESEVAAQRVTDPSGDNIKITNVTASGAGCPAGKWTYDPLPEGNAFNLLFDAYSIEVPASQTKITKQIACNITLTIKTPKNLSYAITSFQYYGYANVTKNMKASLLADYAWTGWGVAPTFKTFTYPVPETGTYAANDSIKARGIPLFFAPCDITSKLQVRSRLVLESSDKTTPGVFTMDAIDANATAALRVTFTTGACPSNTGGN